MTGFQPLDLCNPARTLLLSEELLLYEGRNKTSQVRPALYTGFGLGFSSLDSYGEVVDSLRVET